MTVPQTDALIALADTELALSKGREAELLLREAYEVIYDQVTPLHLQIVVILKRLATSLQMQGKVLEFTETQSLVGDMLANHKNVLADKLETAGKKH